MNARRHARASVSRARVSKNENQPDCARAHTQGGIRTVAIASWRGVLAQVGPGAPMHVSDWQPTALFIALGPLARARRARGRACRRPCRVGRLLGHGGCSARAAARRRDCRDRAVHVSSRELDHQTAARSADEQRPPRRTSTRRIVSVDGLLKFQLDTESSGFDAACASAKSSRGRHVRFRCIVLAPPAAVQRRRRRRRR